MTKKQLAQLEEADEGRTWFGEPIPKVNACTISPQSANQPVGFPNGAAYATQPQNRYQQWLRRNMKVTDSEEEVRGAKGKGKAVQRDKEDEEAAEGRVVAGHYTSRFCPDQIERTVAVPLRPNACHRDIPIALWPNHAKPGGKQYDKGVFLHFIPFLSLLHLDIDCLIHRCLLLRLFTYTQPFSAASEATSTSNAR